MLFWDTPPWETSDYYPVVWMAVGCKVTLSEGMVSLGSSFITSGPL